MSSLIPSIPKIMKESPINIRKLDDIWTVGMINAILLL